MSLLCPDARDHAERVRRLSALPEADLAWLVSAVLDDMSPRFAGMPDDEFARAQERFRRWAARR